MSRRRHPAGPVTVRQAGSDEPALVVSPTKFRTERDVTPATATEETPRLFARRAHVVRDGSRQSDDEDRGYTSVVALALDEPEAVPDDWQTDHSDNVRAEKDAAEKIVAAAILANMQHELDRLRSLIPGDQRGYFREAAHGLQGLARAVN